MRGKIRISNMETLNEYTRGPYVETHYRGFPQKNIPLIVNVCENVSFRMLQWEMKKHWKQKQKYLEGYTNVWDDSHIN